MSLVASTLRQRLRWLPALLWALLVLGLAVDQWRFWHADRIDTDLLALLPAAQQAPALSTAMQRLTAQTQREVVVLVGAATWNETRAAAHAVEAELSHADSPLEALPAVSEPAAAAAQLSPWRNRLLTATQRAELPRASAAQLGETALLGLYQPVGVGLGDWHTDPLGLWPAWWAAQAQTQHLRLREGKLWRESDGHDWIVLRYRLRHAAFAVRGDTPSADALARARTAAQTAVPTARMLTAGIPLHAEAAARAANDEIASIGLGSLCAVLLLVWLCFRSLRPILLVTLSLLVGCALALSVTGLIFERVHLLTLVFGASLVGVAEDYGFHYFAARQGRPARAGHRVLRSLLPGLVLALATSALAYLALGIAPFPGLRQMAVFSVAGLTGAFLTVVCWFPLLDHGALPKTDLARVLGTSLARWPRWHLRGAGLWALAALLLVAGLALPRLQPRDDLRQLYASPPDLEAQQREISHLLNPPSPAQFFLVSAAEIEQLLQREEALRARLEPLVAAGQLHGYRALSGWLPSAARQAQDAALVARAEALALVEVGRATGETPARPTYADTPLRLADLQTGPAAQLLSGLWLGDIDGNYYSVVQLHAPSPSALPDLARAARGLDGVRWIDHTAAISGLLAQYRVVMMWLLLAGYALVFGALYWRYRSQAWRALLPTALGSLLTLALFALIGAPLQLFNVLALLLLLGMGVDYGIFLLEHPGDGAAWLAVALAGLSTLLAFGLLAFSATPALHAFGLTMLVGELAVWFLSPLFRPRLAPPRTAHGLATIPIAVVPQNR